MAEVAESSAAHVREELELVLMDRNCPPFGKFYERTVPGALEVFDLSVSNGTPPIRAAVDAVLWFGKEEVQAIGF